MGEIMSDLPKGYRAVRGSDIRRDGMYLELIEPETGDEIAEVFYADEDGKIVISVFKQDVPLEVIEAFIAKAKHDLPPS
jgi:hypothetical protein